MTIYQKVQPPIVEMSKVRASTTKCKKPPVTLPPKNDIAELFSDEEDQKKYNKDSIQLPPVKEN